MADTNVFKGTTPNYTLKATGKDGIFLDIDSFHLEVIHFQARQGVSEVTDVDPKLPYGVIADGPNRILIPFQFIENIKINERKPSYSQSQVFARFEPLQLWSGSSQLSFSFTTTYLAMGEAGPDIDPMTLSIDNKKKDDLITYINTESKIPRTETYLDEEWVDRMVALLKSLTMPTYLTGGYQYEPPPRVVLKIGNLVNNIPCIITSISRSFDEGMFHTDLDVTSEQIADLKVNNTISSAEASDMINRLKARGGETGVEAEKKTRIKFLPKYQKIELSFDSIYPTRPSNAIDSKAVYKRTEGIPISDYDKLGWGGKGK